MRGDVCAPVTAELIFRRRVSVSSEWACKFLHDSIDSCASFCGFGAIRDENV